MTVELILRYLTKAGLVPQGRVGHSSPHYLAVHLKNLILALAAYLPSEAVEAVQILNGLRCNTNALLNLTVPDGIVPVKKGLPFGDWIVQEIEARRGGRVEADNVASDSEDDLFLEVRRIGMSLAPARAWNTCPNKASDIKSSFYRYHSDSFGSADRRAEVGKKMPVLSRQTTFTVELLIAAGELLADTLAAQAAAPNPELVPGRTGADDATPEAMKVAGPGSHDDLLDTPTPNTRRRRSSNKAQPMASQGSKQLPLPRTSDQSGEHVLGVGSSSHIQES